MRLSGADPAAVLKVQEAATPAVEAILRNADLSKASRAVALQQVSWAGGWCWRLGLAWCKLGVHTVCSQAGCNHCLMAAN